MILLKKFIITLLFMGLGISGQATANNQPPQLSSLINTALRDNPDLQATRARWQIYVNRIVPAASLDDPTLSFAFNNYPVDTFRADETPMTGKVVKLSQRFPFPGKLAAREDAARQISLWYKGVYEDNRLALARQVKDTYFELYYLDKTIAINRQNILLLQNFTKITETRYKVGKGTQQDILKSQIERYKLSNRLLILDQRRQTTIARMNTLLNNPPKQITPTIPEVTDKTIKRTTANLQQQAQKNRPMFAAYKSLIASYKAKQILARLNHLPNFKAGLAYTFREPANTDRGTDFAGIEFGINLPIFTAKLDSAQAEADTGLMMVRKQYENFQNQVNLEIDIALRDIQKNQQLATRYKNSIIPQASQSLEVAMSAYRVGKVSFLTLLDNLMTLYNYEIGYYRVLTDKLHSVARLEAASGTPLTIN